MPASPSSDELEQPSNGVNHRHHSGMSTSSSNNTAALEMQPLALHVSDSSYDENPVQHSFHDIANDQDDLLEDGEEILYPTVLKQTAASSWTWWMSQAWEDYFFPPDIPEACQLLRRENIAVPACYLLVGLLQGLSSVAVNVLPLDLGATEAQQTTVSSIRSLPASFKLLFGFWSDNMPIQGLRRKPYMLAGWLIASLSMLALLLGSNLHVPARNAGCFQSSSDGGDAYERGAIPEDAPTIPFLSLCLLTFGIGFWLADVMGDSIVAEKAKLEPPDNRGSIQSTCYACRFGGMMLAAPASTAIYTLHGPAAVITLLSLLPMAILPLVYLLGEVPHLQVSSTREQCHEIWNTVCSRAVWQPMLFVYLYNVMQVSNAAWREYLVTVLNFTSCQLNLLLIVSFVLLYFGILAYKYYFISWSWRKVYICTTLMNGFFSILQVLLIYGITFGLSPFLFTLGDDAFAEFVMGIQFLPTTIMMVHLCPVGSEGASYAMFTTVNNSALTLSSAISTQLLKIWDVSRTALSMGDLSGMINLTYLTTFCQVAAIAFVGLLPRFKEDLERLGHASAKSTVGGTVFLIITFCSIAYAVSIGVLNIVNPGWMGES